VQDAGLERIGHSEGDGIASRIGKDGQHLSTSITADPFRDLALAFGQGLRRRALIALNGKTIDCRNEY
jgi:hypothetical protein